MTAELLPLLLVPIGVIVGALIGSSARGRSRGGERRLLQSGIATGSFPNGALLLFDRRLRHTLADGYGLRGLGLSREQVEGRTIRETFPPDVCDILEPAYRAALEGHETSLELPYADRDHLIRIAPVRERPGEIAGGVVVTQDVTERKRREYRLSELASRDGLTGLWNRRRLSEELEWLLGEAARAEGRGGSLLLLDLDGFKRVNDTLGHEAGDDLLRKVARGLEGQLRRTDTVARLGGDEFAVLLPGTAPADAERVAEKIATTVETLWPRAVEGGASIGVAAIGAGNWSVGDVLASADRAMYEVKRADRLRAVS